MRAYRTELDPNNAQRTALLCHAGVARFVYNWGLRQKIEDYQLGAKAPTAFDLQRRLNAFKQTEFPWMYEVSKCVPEQALQNLDRAFETFFRYYKNGTRRKGFPRFKSRKRGIGSFGLTGRIHVEDKHIRLPRLGCIRLKERCYLPTDAKVLRATVSERAGRWFVSVLVNEEVRLPPAPPGVIGIDVGIAHLATLSDGTVFENPRALAGAQHRLAHLQRAVSRKRKGSTNRRKAVMRLARQHYRVSCIRSDAIHKASSAIAKRARVVGIESLNVSGMLRNHHIARAMSDAAVSSLLRCVKYKVAWRSGTTYEADRFYASSKTCCRCGKVKVHLDLSERVFRYECGNVIDRDLNAAINLEHMAASSAAAACGEEGSGLGHVAQVKPASVRQEPNTIEGSALDG